MDMENGSYSKNNLNSGKSKTKAENESEELKQQNLYRILIEMANDGIAVIQDGILKYVNPKLAEMGGYTVPEVINTSFIDYIHPEEVSKVHDKYKERLAGRESPGIYETVLRHRDGRNIFVEVNAALIEYDGKPASIVIIRDVSERYELKKELEESEKKHRLLVENLNDIIAVIQNGKIKYVNPAATKVTGYSINELKSKPFFEFIHPEDRQNVFENYQRRLKGEKIQENLIYRITDKNGDLKWVEINCVSINWEEEPAILYICNDVTKRKKIENALKESEEMYRNLVRASYDAVLVIDMDGNIIDASERTLDLLKINTSDEIIGRNVEEFISTEDMEKVRVYFQRVLKTGFIREMDIKLLKKDGTECIGEVNAFMVKSVYESSKKFIVVINDVTDRKRAEKDMKRRLMKFNLNEGEIYLVKEPLIGTSVEAFNDLLNVGYKGVVISRNPEEYFRKRINLDFEYFRIGEIEGALYPEIAEIEDMIENLPGKNAILVDRMDYIIFKNGFKRTLAFIQNLRDIAYFNNHIVILSIDSEVLSTQELKLLEKEVKETELMPRIKLSEGLLVVLRYIYTQNNQGKKPLYSDVSKELSISKPTVRKRVKSLISHGYVREETEGRVKYLELTDKGWYTFLNV